MSQAKIMIRKKDTARWTEWIGAFPSERDALVHLRGSCPRKPFGTELGLFLRRKLPGKSVRRFCFRRIVG